MTRRAASPAFALLLALAAALPFETSQALIRVPPVVFTNLELLLYGFLAVWLLESALKRQIAFPPRSALLALGAFAASQALAAGLAPIERLNAVKGAARLLTGVLLFLASFDQARSRRRVIALVAAFAAGAVAAAALGLLEVWDVAGVRGWLYGAFGFEPVVIYAIRRASGPLMDSNTLSMFLEMGLPALLALLCLRPVGWKRAGAVAALAVVAEGILLTYSRAGLSSALLIVMGFTAGARRLAPTAWRPLVTDVALAALAVAAFQPLGGSELLLRWSRDPASWYGVQYRVPPTLAQAPGQELHIPVTLINTGHVTWVATGTRPFHLAYHWFDGGTLQVIEWEGRRTRLPRDVVPGESVTVEAFVVVPQQTREGDVLGWDMVQERTSWFCERGLPLGITRVETERPLDRAPVVAGGAAQDETAFLAKRRELWRIAATLIAEHPWLGIGPDNYRLLYGSRLADARLWDSRKSAHSLYLETLVGSGVLGGCALVAFLSLWMRGLRRALPAIEPKTERLFGFALALAPGALLLHGLVDHFLGRTGIYGAFWILLGVSWRWGLLPVG